MFAKQKQQLFHHLDNLVCLRLPRELILLISDYALVIFIAKQQCGKLFYWYDELPEWKLCRWSISRFPYVTIPYQTPSMPRPVADFVVTEWRNCMYVFGGVYNSPPFGTQSRDVQCYDCWRRSWSICQTIPVVYGHITARTHAALALGDSILIIGNRTLQFIPNHSHWRQQCHVPSFSSACNAATVV